MILVKKRKSYLCLFMDRIGLEIMFDDHSVKKKPSYIIKIFILHGRHIGYFKEVNP